MNRLIHLILVSFGFLPIIPNPLIGFLPVIFFLVSLVFFLRDSQKRVQTKMLIINSALFFVYIVTLIYTQNIHHALVKLGPATWILLFPLIFYLFLTGYSFKKNTLSMLLGLMTLSSFAFIIVFLTYLGFSSGMIENQSIGLNANQLRGAMIDIPFIGKHPIYAGLFIGISILYCIDLLFSIKGADRLPHRIVLFIVSIGFLAFLFLIQAKGALLYLTISIPIYLGIRLKTKLTPLLILLGFAITIGYVLTTSPKANNRYRELIDAKTYSSKELNPYNSSQIRFFIWKSSIELIKEAPILGYGLGDVQAELNRRYESQSPILLEKTYNSHNQYLGIWLSSGILGLLVFLYFLIANLKRCWASKNHMHNWPAFSFSIIVFFMLNFVTENVLDRQFGSLLFFFLINFLGTFIQVPITPNQTLSNSKD